jgi:type I restriction enzyme, S subunit
VTLRKYPEYVSNPSTWTKTIPSHWKPVRLKWLLKEIDDRAGTQSHELLGLSKQMGVVARDEIDQSVSEANDYGKYKIAQAGDIVMNKMQAWNGVFGIAPKQGIVSPDYSVFRCTDTALTRFLALLFRTDLAAGEFFKKCRGMGTAFLRLNSGDFLDSWIAIPTPREEEVILNCLDRETAKIDALIAEQQRLIELLQEKRQAVISHAVTKGLNPNAAMKDSGVEWLGEVPEHWDVVQIKWLSPVKRGASPRPIEDPKYFDECGEYAWVRISDVTSSNGRLEATSQRLSELGSSLSVKLKPGSLFVSIAGSVGKPCITRIKACIHDGFVYFPDLRINPGFLESIFISGDCFGGLGKLGTQLNLNTDTIGAIRIGVPRVNKEVDAIVEYCKQESERLGELEVAAFGAIYLLNERRSALISAAVTGQIDVRGLMQDEAGQQ